MIGRRAFLKLFAGGGRSKVQLSSLLLQFRPIDPEQANAGSSGWPAFDALHQMHGKVELAKFQLCAKMDPFGEAQYPSRFPLGARLALSDWRTA
jgi:hypothetical protein